MQFMNKEHETFDNNLTNLTHYLTCPTHNYSATTKNRHWKILLNSLVRGAKWLKYYVINLSAHRIINRIKRLAEDVAEKVEMRGRPEKSARRPDWLLTEEGSSADLKAQNLCYVFRILDKNHNFLYEKVGSASGNIRDAARRAVDYNSKDGAEYVVVRKVYDTEEKSGEGLESKVRSYFIERFPAAFKTKDRFKEPCFDLRIINRLHREFMNPPIETEFV